MKTTCILKSRHFIVIAMCFFAYTANAQLKVTSTGNVYMGTSTPQTAAILSLDQSSGYNYTNYSFAVSTHHQSNKSFIIGIKAVSTNANNTNRTFGLQGLAGGGTSGWNYGVVGGLAYPTGNGAGIFGTLTNHTGVNVPGRYAAYFDGATYVDGNITATSFLTPSDIRLKENIKSVSETTDEGSTLENVLNMNVIRYNYKERELTAEVTDTLSAPIEPTGERNSVTHYGLSAQELQEIYPELVQECQDGYLSVNYVELVPLLIRSIQELKAEIDELKGVDARYRDNASGQTSESADAQPSQIYYPITVDGKVIGNKRANKTK